VFKEAFSSFAVPDLDTAKKFYGEVLGLDVTQEEMGFLTLAVGAQRVMIYPKDDHAPAVFTVLNFPVDDLDSAVAELTSRGVTFERYDGFDQDDKGIATMGPDGRIAWFTDPSGNILAVVQMP
jgi:predicted enzyme related to lactoylglutathione lyase